jgi:hypothetical protein
VNTVAARDRSLSPRLLAISPWALALGAVVSIAAAVAVAMAQAQWIGKPFPGFLVLPNRVVASIGRTAWSGMRDGAIYQSLVTAVDGAPVESSAEIYARVGGEGHDVAYTLRRGPRSDVVTMSTQVFSSADYLALFGAYAATGVLYLLLGLLAVALLPTALGRALLVLGGVAGVYALSGAGIYAPGASLRLHALAESLFPAALVHLALVYPGRLRPAVEPWSAVAWAVALAIAVPYQLLLDEPSSYSILHACAETYLGLAGIGLTCRLVHELAQAPREAGPLLRATTAGAVVGLGMPAVVLGLSGISGGQLPVNAVTVAAFAFPLCCAWGLLRERLSVAAPAG